MDYASSARASLALRTRSRQLFRYKFRRKGSLRLSRICYRIEPEGPGVKSDWRDHGAIVELRLYDSLMVTQITLLPYNFKFKLNSQLASTAPPHKTPLFTVWGRSGRPSRRRATKQCASPTHWGAGCGRAESGLESVFSPDRVPVYIIQEGVKNVGYQL